MTRYLDREPQAGDRVEVPAFEAIYCRPSDPSEYPASYNRKFPHRVRIEGTGGYEAWASDVRVIAPEPKVGDVVTADMDLPEGSIIECSSDRYFGICILSRGTWWRDSQTPAQPVFNLTNWRIVRIGGGL